MRLGHGWVLAFALMVSAAGAKAAGVLHGRVTPEFARVFVPAGQSRSHEVRVEAHGVASTVPLDLLVLIDCSGSMQAQLDSVRRQAADILGSIRRANPDVRFAVASFSDYPGVFSKDSRDYPWRLEQPFTAEIEAVRAAFARIEILHGGDVPESYSRALSEAARLEWRERARRIVVLFGDSIAHSVDPGPDAELGTSDDLRIDDAIRDLGSRGISVIAVHESRAQVAGEFFYKVAQATGGRAVPFARGADAARAALAGVTHRLAVPPRLLVNSADGDWVGGITLLGMTSAESSQFSVTLKVPDDASSSVRKVRLKAVHAIEARDEIGQAEVEVVTGWMNDPAVQWWIAIAFGALPLIVLIRRHLARNPTLGLYHFNVRGRWLGIARTAATLAAVGLYVAVIGWAYGKLRDPQTAPLSELVAGFAQQAKLK